MVVCCQGGGRAWISWFRTGTEWSGEVESEINSIAHLLRGALRQLEEMLVVREHVIQGGILLGVISSALTPVGLKLIQRNMKTVMV